MAELERVKPTRYRQAIARVMANYPPGSLQLVIALDIIVQTAMNNKSYAQADELAEKSCLGTLHDGPAKGVICKRCYDALESGKLPPDENDEAGAGAGLGLPAKDESSIASQVHMLLGQEGELEVVDE